MHDVLSLKIEKYLALAEEYQERCREVARSLPRPDLALLCGISYSYLSDILNPKAPSESRKPWMHKWDPILACEAPALYGQLVLSWLYSLTTGGGDLSRLEPEERLGRLETLLRSLPMSEHPAVRDLLTPLKLVPPSRIEKPAGKKKKPAKPGKD